MTITGAGSATTSITNELDKVFSFNPFVLPTGSFNENIALSGLTLTGVNPVSSTSLHNNEGGAFDFNFEQLTVNDVTVVDSGTINGSSGVQFTDVTTSTVVQPYLFGTLQLPPFSFDNFPTQDFSAGDSNLVPPGFITLHTGDMFGLVHVDYAVDSSGECWPRRRVTGRGGNVVVRQRRRRRLVHRRKRGDHHRRNARPGALIAGPRRTRCGSRGARGSIVAAGSEDSRRTIPSGFDVGLVIYPIA